MLRVLTLTRLIDVFPLHATVDEAAGRSRRVAAVPVLPRRHSLASWPRAAMRSAARALAPGLWALESTAGAVVMIPGAVWRFGVATGTSAPTCPGAGTTVL